MPARARFGRVPARRGAAPALTESAACLCPRQPNGPQVEKKKLLSTVEKAGLLT